MADVVAEVRAVSGIVLWVLIVAAVALPVGAGLIRGARTGSVLAGAKRFFGIYWRVLRGICRGGYGLIQRRVFPGLPPLRARTGNVQDDPTAPVAVERSAGAQETLRAILDGHYGDHCLAGKLYDGYDVLIVSKKRTGKSQLILMARQAWQRISNPRANDINLDPKAEFFEAGKHFGGIHFNYTMLRQHKKSSAINIVPDERAARQFAQNILPGDGYFESAARRGLIAACEAVGYTSIVDAYDLLNDPEAIQRAVQRYPRLARVFGGENERRIDDILDTAQTALDALSDPLVRRVFDARGAEEPDFAAGGQHVHICIPISASAAADMCEFVTALMDRLADMAAESESETYLVLDEGASFVRLERIPSYMSTLGWAGLRVILAVQNLAQIEKQLGHESARDIVSNTDIRIAGPISDEGTARLLSGATQEVEAERTVYDRPGRPAGMAELGEYDPRRIDRPQRPKLTTSNLTSLQTGQLFIDTGPGHHVEYAEPASYYTYSDRLAPYATHELDWRGIPPEREPEREPARQPEKEVGEPRQRPPQQSKKRAFCLNCGEEVFPLEEAVCGTCGEEIGKED